MQIGKEIKARRIVLGLTQKDLAGRLGVARAYIADLERDRRSPSLHTIAPVLEELGGSISIKWRYIQKKTPQHEKHNL